MFERHRAANPILQGPITYAAAINDPRTNAVVSISRFDRGCVVIGVEP